ncbi:MAG: putative metal-binding motif-containing protein [Candidatus Uhrbacteria bacterium]
MIRTLIIAAWLAILGGCAEEKADTGNSGDSATPCTETWHLDADADGFGIDNGDYNQVACDQPTGYVNNTNDCDDADPAINPDADELCNGVDDNCDSNIDVQPDGSPPIDATDWWFDQDGDGYGSNMNDPYRACPDNESVVDRGMIDNDHDCNDHDPTVNPDTIEICDGVDNDCDQYVDESGAAGAPTWYYDADADGYGDLNQPFDACTSPDNYVADSTDCNDADASINPDVTEICDGVDNDCSGVVDDNECANP